MPGEFVERRQAGETCPDDDDSRAALACGGHPSTLPIRSLASRRAVPPTCHELWLRKARKTGVIRASSREKSAARRPAAQRPSTPAPSPAVTRYSNGRPGFRHL